MQIVLKYRYSILLQAIIVGVIFYLCNLFSFSYEAFVSNIQSGFSIPHVKKAVAERVTIEGFQQVRTAMKLLLLAACLLSAAIYFFRKRIEENINAGVVFLSKSIKRLFTLDGLSTNEKKVALIVIGIYIIHSLYYIVTKYYEHDECWTYNYFVDSGFLSSFLAPQNNHYGYTLMSWFLTCFWNSIAAMRIISLLAGLTSVLIFIQLAKRFLQERFFFLAIVLYTFSIPVLVYSVSARSYSCTLWMAVIGLYCLLKINAFGNNKRWFAVLVISQAVGLFCNIGYVYPIGGFVISSIILSRNDKALLFNYAKNWFVCALLCLLLVSVPLFVLGGWRALLIGVDSQTDHVYSVIDYFWKSGDIITIYFTGLRNQNWIFFVFMILSIALMFWSKKKIVLIAGIQILLVPIYFAVQQSVLFERLFTYLAVFVSIILISFLERIKISKSLPNYVALAIIPLAILLYTKHFLLLWSIKPDEANYKTFQYLRSKKVDSCYQMFFYAVPAMTYYSKQNKYCLHQGLASIGSLQYAAFDSNRHYQAIISRVEDSLQFNGYKKTVIADFLEVWE